MEPGAAVCVRDWGGGAADQLRVGGQGDHPGQLLAGGHPEGQGERDRDPVTKFYSRYREIFIFNNFQKKLCLILSKAKLTQDAWARARYVGAESSFPGKPYLCSEQGTATVLLECN